MIFILPAIGSGSDGVHAGWKHEHLRRLYFGRYLQPSLQFIFSCSQSLFVQQRRAGPNSCKTGGRRLSGQRRLLILDWPILFIRRLAVGSHFFDRLLGRRYGGGHGGGHHGGGHGDWNGPGPDRGAPWGNRQNSDGDQSAPPVQQRVLVCPNCRSDNTPDSRFCVNCGQRFGSAEAACSKCNAPIAANSRFCPSCGTAVAETNPAGR